MFKIIFLLFTGLVRSLVEDIPTGKFEITEINKPPYTETNCGVDWTGAVVDTDAEPGDGSHDNPFLAAVGGTGGRAIAISKRAASDRCGEMLALFDFDADINTAEFKYIKIANYEDADDSDELELGSLACADVAECAGAEFAKAIKLPKLQVIANSAFDNIMCPGFLLADSGDGTAKENPIYVYVDTAALFDSEHEDCGRLYGFGDKFVAVAGTTASSAEGDGLTLGILEADCEDVETCEMDGYAHWTGEIFAPTASPTEDTTEEETTTPEGTTTESTTTTETTASTSRLPLPDTTTEEDSTFFAVVGFTLFALLA